MATTLNLQNTMNWAAPLLKNQPLMASNLEPALTAANIVLQTILGPPFSWAFNRATVSFPISQANGTDYQRAISDFGFIERAWLVDGSGKVHQLIASTGLAKESAQARPGTIAEQLDDNQGNITFRLSEVPDAAYTVFIDYQKKAALILSPASTWGDVSDQFAYIYSWGFLCIMALLSNDQRFAIYENWFISRLLGAQDGLNDQQKSIFVGNWMALTSTVARNQGNVNAGIAGRSK